MGDSAQVGCGFYAENTLGGCALTGIGEAIMQVGLAKTVVEFLADGLHPDDAAQQCHHKFLGGFMNHTIRSRRAAKTPAIVVLSEGLAIVELLSSQRRVKEYALIPVQLASEVPRLLKQRPIRLVVCDDRAPGMHSFDLMSMIKQLSPQTHVVLVVPSGSPEQEHRAKAAGADAYLPWAFAHRRLHVLLDDLLS